MFYLKLESIKKFLTIYKLNPQKLIFILIALVILHIIFYETKTISIFFEEDGDYKNLKVCNTDNITQSQYKNILDKCSVDYQIIFINHTTYKYLYFFPHWVTYIFFIFYFIIIYLLIFKYKIFGVRDKIGFF